MENLVKELSSNLGKPFNNSGEYMLDGEFPHKKLNLGENLQVIVKNDVVLGYMVTSFYTTSEKAAGLRYYEGIKSFGNDWSNFVPKGSKFNEEIYFKKNNIVVMIPQPITGIDNNKTGDFYSFIISFEDLYN